MQKIAILSNGNEMVTQEFISHVYSNKDVEVHLFTYEVLDKEYLDFYKQHAITLHVMSHIKGSTVVALLQMILKVKRISQTIQFDIIHVHYVSIIKLLLSSILKNRYSKLILTFWGSDVMQANYFQKSIIYPYICHAAKVTFCSERVRISFIKSFGYKFEKKSVVLGYGNSILDEIIKVKDDMSKEQAKARLGLPLDKIIIAIGYNGDSAQQHLRYINVLKALPVKIKNKVHVVLQLTYGGDNQYFDLLQEKLDGNDSGGGTLFLKHGWINKQVLCLE